MQDTMKRKNVARVVPRNPTDAAITCRPYTRCRAIFASDGVMRNFSSYGSYIETSHKYESGTILIVRMTRYPSLASSLAAEEGLRSICLAEVKWQQELADKNAIRYGIGLRYLT